jgi:ABC-type phosphate transport system substrate-binding protein
MRARGILHLLVVVAVLGLASTSIANDVAFKVIVNPELSIDSVDRDFLRDAYLKKATEWGNGDTIRPVDLSAKFAARDQFTEHVLRKTPSQLKTYWNQQIFSGKGVPPPEADSVQGVVEYVLENKGAVGYIPADADPGKAIVVRIR